MQSTTTPNSAAAVDPRELERRIAAMYRDVANEAKRDLHFPTGRRLAEELGYPAGLLYVAGIAAAGLELQVIQGNPGYRFISERAQRASHKYGAHSISLLALKPTTTTEEVSK